MRSPKGRPGFEMQHRRVQPQTSKADTRVDMHSFCSFLIELVELRKSSMQRMKRRAQD